eukprot:4386640-Ditylum_brightwellii.AAC.1
MEANSLPLLLSAMPMHRVIMGDKEIDVVQATQSMVVKAMEDAMLQQSNKMQMQMIMSITVLMLTMLTHKHKTTMTTMAARMGT